MATVIRLDTAALKHLLEVLGPEFVVELKSAVLSNALKVHAGIAVEHETHKELVAAVDAEVKRQISEEPWKRYPTLRDGLHDRIASAVKNHTHDLIWEAIHGIEVEDIIQKSIESWAEHVKKRVYHAMQSAVVKWAGEEVERRLNLLNEEE